LTEFTFLVEQRFYITYVCKFSQAKDVALIYIAR